MRFRVAVLSSAVLVAAVGASLPAGAAQPSAGFSQPQVGVANYAYNVGGWRVEKHPRLLADVNGDSRADVNGDGRADIVGFGDNATYVSLGKRNGTFTAPQVGVANYAYNVGGWRVEKHPRLLADVNGDGRADIVGFGDNATYVSLGLT